MSQFELPPLAPEISALLSAERSRTVPPDMRERVAFRLAAIIGPMGPSGGDGGGGDAGPDASGGASAAGASGGAAGASAASGAAGAGAAGGGSIAGAGAASTGTAVATKGILGALVGASKPLIAAVALTVGVAGGAGVQSLAQREDRPAVTTTAEPRRVRAPEATAPSPPTPAQVPVTEPVPSPVVESASPSGAAPSVSRVADGGTQRGSPLAQEQSLIERARSALARGRAREALEALSAHARRFPRGQMMEEREGLRIQALAAAGAVDAARAQADEFRARYPRSVLQPSLDRALTPPAPDRVPPNP